MGKSIHIHKGQTWISESNPEESFCIYGWMSEDINCSIQWENRDIDDVVAEQKEDSIIYFWKRINYKVLNDVTVNHKKTFAGECKKHSIINKIKKYNMKLGDMI